MGTMYTSALDANVAAERWRRHFLPEYDDFEGHTPARSAFETAMPESAAATGNNDDPVERIKRAREAMIKLIRDEFGGDRSLMDGVEKIALTSEEALAILMKPTKKLDAEHLASFEAIVAFDGTRPSFLVKNNEIDFTSSFNTANWKHDLAPHAERLATLAACVGRVELNEEHVGTAFLVTPTLAITNRHVAQAIARFENDKIRTAPGATLDFGRERWNSYASFDRRDVLGIPFAGSAPIVKPIVHQKLDLAVLRLSSSQLAGDLRHRHLATARTTGEEFEFAKHVIAVGYPAKPDDYVPEGLKTEFVKVLERLLEGDGGAKRLAPGRPAGVLTEPPAWTAMHDATTINGNSGSPLVVIKHGPKAEALAAGLHYGGDWGGGRVNWAHLLAPVDNAVGYGGKQSFAQFCKAEGIGS
jgi:hypothetical protein